MTKEPRTPTTPRPRARTSTRPSPQTGASRGVPPRHLPTRHRREERYQRLGLIGAAVILVIVGSLLGVGWYETYVRPYHETVIVVGNRSVDMNAYIQTMKQILPQFTSSDPSVVVAVVPDQTTEQIEDQLILLERAGQAGVQVSQQEIETQMAKDLSVSVDKNGQPTNRAAYETALRAKLSQTGLSLSQFQEQAETELLQTKVQDKLAADQPKAVPQVKYSEIILNSQDDANKLLAQLKKGESWDTAVAGVRNNPTTGSVADFDFQPQLQVDSALAPALFKLSPNQYTGVINTSDGKYVIARLVQKDNNHPLTAAQRQAIAPDLFSNWLAAQKKTLTIKDQLSDNQKAFALEHAGYNPSSPQQQPVQQPTVPANISTPAGGLQPQASPQPQASAPAGQAAPAATSSAPAPAATAKP